MYQKESQSEQVYFSNSHEYITLSNTINFWVLKMFLFCLFVFSVEVSYFQDLRFLVLSGRFKECVGVFPLLSFHISDHVVRIWQDRLECVDQNLGRGNVLFLERRILGMQLLLQTSVFEETHKVK